MLDGLGFDTTSSQAAEGADGDGGAAAGGGDLERRCDEFSGGWQVGPSVAPGDGRRGRARESGGAGDGAPRRITPPRRASLSLAPSLGASRVPRGQMRIDGIAAETFS